MQFRVIGEIREVETIAAGRGVRGRARLNRLFGRGRWRKLKGIATVEQRGEIFAELHWYEAHGIGRRLMKIKET
jgi:hypothetical protein